MELENKVEEIPDNQMEMEYSDEIFDEIEEYENLLFQQLPIQTNQNSSVVGCIPIWTIPNYLHQNYMFQSVLFNKPMQQDKHIFNEIMRIKDTENISHKVWNKVFDRKPEQNATSDIAKFEYSLNSVKEFHEEVAFETNCDWLDSRLQIHESMDCSHSLDYLLTQLRTALINTAINVMVYSHTTSDFALQLFKNESYNLLIMLKHPGLESVVKLLSDGFSPQLLGYLRDNANLEDSDQFSRANIHHLAKVIMENYALIEPIKSFKNYSKSSLPIVVYYSFFVPSSMITNGASMNGALDRKIVSLQRKFKCKINVNGPFYKNVSSTSKTDYYQIEVFFDYFMNYWTLVNQEFIRWMNRFPRCSVECSIDKICVGYVAHGFFCCEEVKDITKKQHCSRDMDVNFVRLVEWIKVYQVDRFFI